MQVLILEALDAQAELPADAVVLDVLMPRLDGLETCRRLRSGGPDVMFHGPGGPGGPGAAFGVMGGPPPSQG